MENTVLETLNLPDDTEEIHSNKKDCDEATTERINDNCPCILCDKIFNEPTNKTDILEHFVLVHKLVIADVNLIQDFKRYVLYWKKRFSEKPISEFCYLMKTNSSQLDIGPQEMYYFLCDNLPEDHDIRAFIQNDKLCQVLDIQQKERSDGSFTRGCLFCRQVFTGNRSELLDHMAVDHAFNLGHPDNIVYVAEFLDRLRDALTNMQCLYCEKIFKDRLTLKEHMRKKQHRQLNPKNTTYDKYYIVNYLEAGKNWETLQNERDMPDILTRDDCTHDREWDDWRDDVTERCVCLFCPVSSRASTLLLSHMKDAHGFDLDGIKTRLSLSFYQQVKLINFIRRQTHLTTCYACGTKAETQASLLDHMTQEGHVTRIPDTSVWDQSLYYFPTYENDSLLCSLDDGALSTEPGCHDDVDIIPEDAHIVQTDDCILMSVKT